MYSSKRLFLSIADDDSTPQRKRMAGLALVPDLARGRRTMARQPKTRSGFGEATMMILHDVWRSKHPRVRDWWTKLQAQPAYARANFGPFIDS
jgi:hypothetical protein